MWPWKGWAACPGEDLELSSENWVSQGSIREAYIYIYIYISISYLCMRYIFMSNHELEVHRAGGWEGEMDVKRERARTSWNPRRLTGIQVSSPCFQPWWCGILQEKLAPCTKELNTHLAQKKRWSRTQGTRGQSQSWLLPDKEVGRQTEWYTRASAHLASTGAKTTASSLLLSKSRTKMSLMAHPT